MSLFVKILITVGLLVGMGALAGFQIRKVQEVASRDNGLIFISKKSKFYAAIVFSVIFYACCFVATWIGESYLIFFSIGFTLIAFEIVMTCVCALNDKALFIMQEMPLKFIREIRSTEKGRGYQVSINFNGQVLKQGFSLEGYEYIKVVKQARRDLASK